MPHATIAVSVGRGQELYGDQAPWLEEFRARARSSSLRRNFRNTRPVFQLAQAVFEAGYDHGRIAKAVSRFRSTAIDDQLEFLRESGDFPELRYVDDMLLSKLPVGDPGFGHDQHKFMVEEYTRVLRHELERLRDDEWPVDVLVLVPSIKSLEREWAAAAILRMQEDYDFLDYTEESLRRVPARPLSIRLCTFHSARGIEGTRAVVFGIEQLRRVAESVGVSMNTLAYITLSRAVAECIIVVPSSKTNDESVRALECALELLRGGAQAYISRPARTFISQDTRAPSEGKWRSYRRAGNLLPDAQVRHPQFGLGRVIEVRPGHPEAKLVVEFEGGTKLLVASAPGLEVRVETL